MGVYIKGMEMPTSCLECDWCAHTIPADNYICYRLNRAVIGVAVEDVNETVNACCPLVPVPPHGRLIDADAFVNKHFGKEFLSKVMTADEDDLGTALINIPLVINNAPTIIPAEEGE